MNKNIKNPLIIWVVCLVVFFVSLYLGGIQNGSFIENQSQLKNLYFIILLGSVLIGIISFFILVVRIILMVKRRLSENRKVSKPIQRLLFIGLVFLAILFTGAVAAKEGLITINLVGQKSLVDTTPTPSPSENPVPSPTNSPQIPKPVYRNNDPIISWGLANIQNKL